MPLKLRLENDSKLPVDARQLSQAVNQRLTPAEIALLTVWVGKRPLRVGQCFGIDGDLTVDRELHIDGDLGRVHHLGQQMAGGKIVATGSVGRHVGAAMTGGEILIQSNASDYVGAAMTGGLIEILGNAGDFVGANLEGDRYGNNGGEIIIGGNAGNGLGRRMRRGVIVVIGDVGDLAAWEMLAGTIVVLGRCGQQVGANISRGTLVLGSGEVALNQAFTRGTMHRPPVIDFLQRYFDRALPQSVAAMTKSKLKQRTFVQYHGVEINGNRAEIFIAADDG